MPEYSIQEFEDFTPRAGNDSGGGQLGNAIKCKPGGANDYLYIVVQEHVWKALAKRIGGDNLVTDARFDNINVRRKNQAEMWQLLENFASNYTKRELMEVLNEIDVPCGPIMSTKDLANDEHVKLREMYVELDHPERGKWFNLGCPIKLSDSPVEIERSPLLGEHTEEILSEVLGYKADQVSELKQAGAFTKEPPK
jgi:formyl-CoA transferase